MTINCTLGYSTKDIVGKCRIMSKVNIIKNKAQAEIYRSNTIDK